MIIRLKTESNLYISVGGLACVKRHCLLFIVILFPLLVLFIISPWILIPPSPLSFELAGLVSAPLLFPTVSCQRCFKVNTCTHKIHYIYAFIKDAVCLHTCTRTLAGVEEFISKYMRSANEQKFTYLENGPCRGTSVVCLIFT